MDNYEKTKEDYDSKVNWHTEKSISYDWKAQIDRFIKSLKGIIVLDAGCGGGRDIKEFIRNSLEVDGIDYSKKTLKACKEKFPETKFYEGDIRNTKLPSNKYDGIWACASILNLKKEEVPTVLSEFKRILKPEGTLFISVKEGIGESMVPDQAGERFFSFYSLDELKKPIQEAGFKITHTKIISDKELTGKAVEPVKPNWICIYAVNS
jgi:ubiquinone/menaquinone biosynthesis C-methylase UbiE|tara:strand:+ start:1348 stop:1971 length:624 start_codon:yes stop_codon:yes gene_type:complete